MSKDKAKNKTRAQIKGEYDAEVKRILSVKCVLARIMKYTVEELAEYSEEKIITFIEGDPVVAEEPLYEAAATRVFGIDSVDTVPGEGRVTFDIVFTVKNVKMKMYINIEAQNNSNPGYDIVTRAVYYCARLLSKQYGREFTGKNYTDIKKVYSIWICTNPKKSEKGFITKYSIEPKALYGDTSERARFDLMTVVMVGLMPNSENELIRVLYTLLTNAASKEEKLSLIASEFGEEVAEQMEGGIGVMCNLSEYIEEKGIEKGIEIGTEKGFAEGTLNTLVDLYLKKLLSYDDAVAQSGDKEAFDKLVASRSVCV